MAATERDMQIQFVNAAKLQVDTWLNVDPELLRSKTPALYSELPLKLSLISKEDPAYLQKLMPPKETRLLNHLDYLKKNLSKLKINVSVDEITFWENAIKMLPTPNLTTQNNWIQPSDWLSWMSSLWTTSSPSASATPTSSAPSSPAKATPAEGNYEEIIADFTKLGANETIGQENARLQALQKQKEEQEKLRLEEERKQQEEQEKLRLEAEQKQKEEQEKLRLEEEHKQQEEQEKRRVEEQHRIEVARKEAEAMRQQEQAALLLQQQAALIAQQMAATAEAQRVAEVHRLAKLYGF